MTLIEPATLSRLQFGDSRLAAEPAMRLASRRQASDGSMLWWGGTDTPGPPQMVAPGTAAPVMVAIAPMRPGHSVAVEYRVNGGPVREAIGVIEPRIQDAKARIFRAIVPGQSDGLVEFLPVLRFAGQPISTRLGELAECPRYRVGNGAAPIETSNSPPRTAPVSSESRWPWSTRFLGACTIQLRKEVVGALADGLRINWRFEEARFVGPVLEGAFLPGAADWMRIRPDGVGIVQVLGCIETRTGARIDTSYGGIVDLGRDGYARALRGELRSVALVRGRADVCDGGQGARVAQSRAMPRRRQSGHEGATGGIRRLRDRSGSNKTANYASRPRGAARLVLKVDIASNEEHFRCYLGNER